VATLWKFYEHIMSGSPDSLDTDLMEEALQLRKVGLSTLTMGMFWARPSIWVSCDSKNVKLAKEKGVAGPPTTAEQYQDWLAKVIDLTGGSIAEFSQHAHLAITHGGTTPDVESELAPPLDRIFADLDEANECLDFLKKIIIHLQGGSEKHDPRVVVSFLHRIPIIRLNYGNWVVCTFGKKGIFDVLLKKDDPLMATASKTWDFKEPVEGKIYSGGRLDREIIQDPETWSAVSSALGALLLRFKGWRQSNYAAFHSEKTYQAVMNPESREQFLTQGIEPIPGTQTPRSWLLAPGANADQWQDFQDNGIAGMGWNETGDLTELETPDDFREIVRKMHPNSGASKVGKMLRDFAKTIQLGDRIFAKEGKGAVVGYGIVESNYYFDADKEPFKHLRKVRWMSAERIDMPPDIGLPIQTLSPIDRRPELIDVLSKHYDLEKPDPVERETYTKEDALADLFMEETKLDAIIELLKRKKNIILQGAPGTGKTFVARRLAYLLMGFADQNRAPMVQFHQSSSYEDFIQGYRPDGKGGFELKDGTFYTFCKEALEEPEKPYVLIIDEINRGNLSKILGELMMLIEPDKRDEEYGVPLAYAVNRDERFHVPANVYLIGTMNTADRSLSMVDYALRRRFAFIECDPAFDSPGFREFLQDCDVPDALIKAIVSRMVQVNAMIAADSTSLGRGYRIGHSFFVPGKESGPDQIMISYKDWYMGVVKYEILPLLEEYWIDDPASLETAKTLLGEPIGI
jgi:5-methylcytosine-specific restriction protein B